MTAIAIGLATLASVVASCHTCSTCRNGSCAAMPSADSHALSAPVVDAAAATIDAGFLRSQIRALSDDRFEGRGPGTEGDRAARRYLSGQLEEIGFEPAFAGGSWEQPFDIVGVNASMPATWSFRAPSGETADFAWWDDYIAASGVQQERVAIDDAEVVFVGYGIQAPEEDWDDFKDVDVRGKVLLLLNNDPADDADLFGGKRRLYYGRWTYKYESAAHRGAAGAILIHTRPSAGYPWQVVQTSWDGEQFELPAGDEPRTPVHGWLTEPAARQLVSLGGRKLDDLVQKAQSRDFHPVPLGVTTSLHFTCELSRTQTANVGGVLRGTDLADEVVIYSAHHDHLGVRTADAGGDAIYNGALDNASGDAQALAVARAIASLPSLPRRTSLVLFVGAEEQGLLGSKHYARHPTFPPGRIAADINFELGNIWGRTRDVAIFGQGKSTLEDRVAELAELQGRHVGEETSPDQGWYYRSDQFSFARIGVPAIWFKSGTDFIGRPEGWGQHAVDAWIEEHYHQPSDEIRSDWNFDGMVEDARLALRLGLAVSNADAMPKWYPGDEFEDEREAAIEADRP